MLFVELSITSEILYNDTCTSSWPYIPRSILLTRLNVCLHVILYLSLFIDTNTLIYWHDIFSLNSPIIFFVIIVVSITTPFLQKPISYIGNRRGWSPAGVLLISTYVFPLGALPKVINTCCVNAEHSTTYYRGK